MAYQKGKGGHMRAAHDQINYLGNWAVDRHCAAYDPNFVVF